MYCKNCGNEMRDGAAFCPKCGNKVVRESTIEKNEEIKQQSISTHIEGKPEVKEISLNGSSSKNRDTSKKKIIIAGVLAVLVIIAMWIINQPKKLAAPSQVDYFWSGDYFGLEWNNDYDALSYEVIFNGNTIPCHLNYFFIPRDEISIDNGVYNVSIEVRALPLDSNKFKPSEYVSFNVQIPFIDYSYINEKSETDREIEASLLSLPQLMEAWKPFEGKITSDDKYTYLDFRLDDTMAFSYAYLINKENYAADYLMIFYQRQDNPEPFKSELFSGWEILDDKNARKRVQGFNDYIKATWSIIKDDNGNDWYKVECQPIVWRD